MDPNALRTQVEAAIQAKLDKCEAFTSACISHPIIAEHPEVRHREVSNIIRDLWAQGNMMGSDGGIPTDYIRTSITVYPGDKKAQSAFLYHPDNGYDPYSFQSTTRVLVRKEEDSDPGRDVDMDADLGDGGQVITNLITGSSVSEHCSIQAKNAALNIPRFVIKAAGFQAGDTVFVDEDNIAHTVAIHKEHVQDSEPHTVDKEGRIRLYGSVLYALCGGTQIMNGLTFSAMVAHPDNGEKYIWIF